VAKIDNFFKQERHIKLQKFKNKYQIKENYKKRRLLLPKEEEFLEQSFRENPKPTSKRLNSM